MIRPSEQEIRKLVNFYRGSVKQLTRDFMEAVDFEKPRLFSAMQQGMSILAKLDSRAETWARRNIARFYGAVQRDTARELAGLGLTRRGLVAAGNWSVLNQEAIEALLWDPQTGFVSSLQGATQEIRDRLATIHRQSKLLEAQGKIVDETIARVGFMEGKTIQQVKEGIMRDLLSRKATSNMAYRNAVAGKGNVLSNLADIPYVKFPTVGGGERTINLADYAETLARTKTSQAMGLARRHKLLQQGQNLVMFSKNLALEDDACNLYVGRVFALTKEAAEENDVPMVIELPGGGCPLHPNCTHNEQGYYPEVHEDDDEDVKEESFSRPPAWALNRPWREVQKRYEKAGGNAFAQKNNPNYSRAHTTGGRERRKAG